MDNELKQKIAAVAAAATEKGCQILENEPLSKYTTFKIGGNADLMIEVENVSSIAALYAMCTAENVPSFVIGNGSNLLVSDDGYSGVVFKLGGDFKNIVPVDEYRVKCGAALSLAKLCKYASDHSLSGLEFAWGIPGTVGGAAYMNAGAYNGEMKKVIESVSYISPSGEAGTLSNPEMKFSYRHSRFVDVPGIITSVTFRLKRDSKENIRERMDDYMNRRRTKQPLEYPSAGSVFKRPKDNFAGGLIQECGLKGKQIGGAQVSEKHAGFIINKGGATCKDVCELVEFIQETVLREKGIKLECEIKRI